MLIALIFALSRANTAQSIQLFSVWCVLATLKSDELVFWTPRFIFLDSELFRFDSKFWMDYA